jgi:hypothetical protein
MAEVESFHVDGSGGGDVTLASLGPLLGAEEPVARGVYVLLVRRPGGGRLGFRTGALVRLGRALERDLYRLPRALREAGCADWIRGVLAEERGAGAGGPPRIWISLAHLARTVEGPA